MDEKDIVFVIDEKVSDSNEADTKLNSDPKPNSDVDLAKAQQKTRIMYNLKFLRIPAPISVILVGLFSTIIFAYSNTGQYKVLFVALSVIIMVLGVVFLYVDMVSHFNRQRTTGL